MAAMSISVCDRLLVRLTRVGEDMKDGQHRYGLVSCISAVVLVAACDAPESPREEPVSATEAAVEHSRHWGYESDNGPEFWAKLNPDYALCGDGREQSPVDISDASPAELPGLTTKYQAAAIRIIRNEDVDDVVNNGHTIQVNHDEGSVLSVGDIEYELAQFHFHAPSEHTVNGRHTEMEMHLVHQAESGALAVLGVLINAGSHNQAFDPVWAELPDEVGEEIHLEDVQINVDDLLPSDLGTYRYRGSLTTPPCSESVSWFVAVDPIELSAEQIGQFTAIISGNNRPTQDLGGRDLQVDRVTLE